MWSDWNIGGRFPGETLVYDLGAGELTFFLKHILVKSFGTMSDVLESLM